MHLADILFAARLRGDRFTARRDFRLSSTAALPARFN
jgi:hypothetical protein